MELATALIWTLRIVLPIIVFCIYFKLQSPKDEVYPGPTKNVVLRSKFLSRRRVVVEAQCPVPEELRTIALKDQIEAPSLFVQSERSMRSGRGADRSDRARGNRKPAAEGEGGPPPRERREKREGGGGGGKRDKNRELPEEAEVAKLPAEATEDKMHLESLLNYVAFNRKEQQRTFLPDDEAAPPPPPPKPPPAKVKSPVTADKFPILKSLDVTGKETTEKANQEAQLVLRGAISYKRSDVAKDIYDQLAERQVEISEKTFTLMIEACVLAKDLKIASNFLMKMETSGFCPDSELLDKVMDLYAQQKAQKEQELIKPEPTALDKMFGGIAAAPAAISMPPLTAALSGAPLGDNGAIPGSLEDAIAGARAKLRTDAPLFVPSFAVPAPPPPLFVPGGDQKDAQIRSSSPDVKDEIVNLEPQRTKLAAAAKPFEPQFNVTFFPDTHTWSFEEKWEESGKDESGKSGGKGRHNNGDGKSKGKGGKADAAEAPAEKENVKQKTDGKDKDKKGAKTSKSWKPKEAPS